MEFNPCDIFSGKDKGMEERMMKRNTATDFNAMQILRLVSIKYVFRASYIMLYTLRFILYAPNSRFVIS